MPPRTNRTLLSIALICLLLTSGCAYLVRTADSSDAHRAPEATSSVRDNPCDDATKANTVWKRAGIGAIIGAVVGSALGFALDRLFGGSGVTGAVVGGAVGAAGGATAGYNVGADLFRRQCEIHRIAQQAGVPTKIEVISAPKTDSEPIRNADVVGSVTTLAGLGHFEHGSAELTPGARDYFSKIADQYTSQFQENSTQRLIGKPLDEATTRTLREHWAQLRLVLIGHTDDTGDPEESLALSERRARTVAELFRSRGVPEHVLYYQGAGSSLPIGNNRTEDGREVNRRVEIVELRSDEHLSRYLSLRQPNPDLYRPDPDPPQAGATIASSDSARPPSAPHEPLSPPRPTVRDHAETSAIVGRPGDDPPIQGQRSATPPPPPAPPVVDPPSAPHEPLSPPRPTVRDHAETSAIVGRPGDDPRIGGQPGATPPPPPAPPVASPQSPQDSEPPRGGPGVSPVQKAVTGAAKQGLEVDFGGVPAALDPTLLAGAFGTPRPSGWSWGFIPQAVADEKVYEVACTRDDPRKNAALPVKELKSDQPAPHYKTGDYIPGLYGTSWTEMVNGHLVALTRVSVLRAGGRPVTNPPVLVFKDYRTGAATDVAPTHSVRTYVKAYQGSEGLLYRLYAVDKQVFACADIVFPYRPPFVARGGRLFYAHPDGVFVAPYRPKAVD